VVTPDGELRTASPDREPELFWALRGGGGDVGIVTGFEFDLHEVGPIVAGLSTFYPGAAAEEVLAAYREATAAAPRQLTTICNHGEIPAIPGMPPELHGEPAIGVIGCHVGDPEAGMDAIAPFRELAGVEPLVDNSDPLPYEALHEVGTLLHQWGRKYVHRSAFVDDLSPEVRSLIVERTEAAPGPMDGVGVWHMGGAVRDGPDAAFPWREPSYMLVVEAAWEGHDAPAHMSWARETDRLLREAGAEGRYANYAGVEEGDDEDWRAEAYGDARERLAAAKRRYDPDDLLGGSLGVDPADANPDADASAAD
jgi:FAD/FMN-containing dehydrogenase